MLRKDVETSWTEDCQKAFDKIKEYLTTLPVLVSPEPGQPLFLYLSVLDGAFGCVLGQHNETRRKEHTIYYLSKKFTPYEARIDPLKYIFQKPMPTGKLAKWQILLSEFDIVYVTQKAIKGQALEDHLAEKPVGGAYEPLKTYFLDEKVSFIGEDIIVAYDGWRMFFDDATNFKGVGIGALLVSKTGQHYQVSATLKFPCTNNMEEYEACILGLNMAVDMNIQELLVIDKNYIDPIPVEIHNHPTYCAYVEEEMDRKPWFHDIKECLSKVEYLEHANHTQKRTLRRLSNHFFHRGWKLTEELLIWVYYDVSTQRKLLSYLRMCMPGRVAHT
ncbi:uncharacterized protein [Nicotiana sylvestris]|uniref:uncharacterized protein n=1 Tax=Nicotiana sylvestris TaxID=4096 RepID=UPI00388CC55A